MNESPAGRDGYILARGRKLYHIYKQSFPMEFWYGLTPADNREDAVEAIDVRTLPEKYRTKPVTVEWTTLPSRSMRKALVQQLRNHALAFSNAIADGYSLEGHCWRRYAEKQFERIDQQAELAARKAANVCISCGIAPAVEYGWCDRCLEITF